MKTKITVDEKKNLIDKMLNESVDDLLAVLYVEAEMIMADSKENFTPVITGHLRNSGFVTPPDQATKSGTTAGIDVGFTASYAWEVHERPPTMGQGKSKFLEKPTMKAMKGMDGRVAKRFKERLRSKYGGV